MLLQALGAGGMGVVYAAYDPELDRKVALKLLLPRADDSADSQGRARLVREAQALAKLSHPNVVAVHDVGTHDDSVWIAMEFVAGQTLSVWATERPRKWAELLPVLIDVARGVTAAHQTGLVHRDLKPDNVMIDRDDRVRVMDFGLAHGRSVMAEPALASTLAADTKAHPELAALALRLTAVGSVQGTPAYMAPEQWQGHEAEPATDQFGWSVMAWELLYGERPFVGETMMTLAAAVLTGKRKAPPRGSRVPGWLRRVIERGLAIEPAQRWPDMNALLLALSVDPGRTRRRWLVGIGIAGLAVTGGMLSAQRRNAEAELCQGSEGLLRGVWDDERAAAVSAALTATGRDYAREAWPRVQEQLNMYAKAWREMHVEVCEATHVRRVQSPRLMDLQMACLQERRAELRAAVEVLAGADARVAERAVQLATGLRPLASCADPRSVGRDLDPETAAAVQAVREQLSQVRAEELAGRFTRGLELARVAVSAAERSGYEPVWAEALLHRGRMEDALGDYVAAEQTLEQSYLLAEALGEDATRAEAALRLLHLVGEPLGREHDAMQWGRQGEAVLHRIGDPADLEAPLRANLGVVHTRFGRYDEAVLALNQAIVLETRPRHPQAAVYQRELGNVYYRRGEYTAAEVTYQFALELGEAALGPDHPENARTINNLGEAHRMQGDIAEAGRCFTRSIEVLERAFGPDHPLLGPPLNGLGTLAFNHGDFATATTHFERVRDLIARTRGPTHPDVGAVIGNLAEILLRQGALVQSQQANERALEILSAALGPEHTELVHVHCNLARSLFLQGQLDAATSQYQRAVALVEKAHGPDFPLLAIPLAGLGMLALTHDGPDEALPVLERALALNGLSDPAEFAELRLSLARALWDTRKDRARARSLVEQARVGLAEATAVYVPPDLTNTLERWLAEHPAP